MSLKRSWVADQGYATHRERSLGEVDRTQVIESQGRPRLTSPSSTTIRAMASNGELGAPTRWVDVNGLRVHCLTAGGDGSPVVLLHGGGIDSASFTYSNIIGPLAEERYVFAPDWPGYGHSDKPDLCYAMGFYVDFLGRLMDALGLKTASLVGISMGGGAALGFALRSPERVEKLVLVDSYGLGSSVPWGRLGYLLVRAPLVNELTFALLRRSRTMIRWSLYGLVYDRQKVTEEMVEEISRLLDDPLAGRAWGSFQKNEVGWGGLRTDFSDRLRRLVMPTLLVHGARDRAVPLAWARRAQERIPDCELRVFSECGHLPPREQPEEFAWVVGRFLSR
jgi:pimeloyl-ACP methyl ester carboxylesterase